MQLASSSSSSRGAALFFFFFLLWNHVNGLVGPDGLCPLYTFVPLTDNDQDAIPISGRGNPGFLHMAAALLAMQHFNERNTSVVEQLSDFTKNCSFQFDLENSRFFDSGGTTSHMAARLLEEATTTTNTTTIQPCAIAGPFYDVPAVDLSVMAQAKLIPLVAHRAFSLRVVSRSAQYSSLVYPDLLSSSELIYSFLSSKGRTNYITILYPATEIGIQFREVMAKLLNAMLVDWYSESYLPPGSVKTQTETDDLPRVLQRVQERGFRTIVCAPESSTTELPAIAVEAQKLNMNDYFWLWYGAFDFRLLNVASKSRNDVEQALQKLLFGSAWITALETMIFNRQNDAFYRAITNFQNVELLNSKMPIAPGRPGHVQAATASSYFTDNAEFGQGFLYDAIMSIGMGMCLANTNNNVISGISHVQGIRQTHFVGASGVVKYDSFADLQGARVARSAYWVAFNFVPTTATSIEDGALFSAFQTTDYYWPSWGEWRNFVPYVYASGGSTPPLLRQVPPGNYLHSGLRILGFCFLGIVILTACATCIWVFVHRSHQVLRAAQPSFLYAICFGSCVFAVSIIALSFDESSNMTATQLSAACMAVPWLVAMGFVIIYGALFSKLFRVNKVLQFTRRRVDISDSVWPAALLFLAALVVLGLWTGLDPLRWERLTINDYTGESVGKCESNNMVAFVAPLAIVMVIPMILTGWMAWKTRDVDDAYTESTWIFVLIVLQLEIVLLGMPVIAILRTLSTNGAYVGYTIIVWCFPMSTLILIMLPKVMALHRATTGQQQVQRFKRGQRGPTRISGMNNPTYPPTTTAGSGTSHIHSLSSSHNHSAAEQHSLPPPNNNSSFTTATTPAAAAAVYHHHAAAAAIPAREAVPTTLAAEANNAAEETAPLSPVVVPDQQKQQQQDP